MELGVHQSIPRQEVGTDGREKGEKLEEQGHD